MKAAIWQDDDANWNLSMLVDGDPGSALATGTELAEIWKTAAQMGFDANEVVVMRSKNRSVQRATAVRRKVAAPHRENSKVLRLFRSLVGR